MEKLVISQIDCCSSEPQTSSDCFNVDSFSHSLGTVNCGIDLNHVLVSHIESTFYARVCGDSMCDVGIDDGDILVVDKSISYRDDDMAVCVLNGEFVVKFVKRSSDDLLLTSAKADVATIAVRPGDRFEIWGIVTYVIKKMRGRS